MNHIFLKNDKYSYIRGELLSWWESIAFTPALKGQTAISIFEQHIQKNASQTIVIDCIRLTDVDINFIRALKDYALERSFTQDFIFVRNGLSDLKERLTKSGFHAINTDEEAIIAANISDLNHRIAELPNVQETYLKFIKTSAIEAISNTFSLNDKNDANKFKKLYSTPLTANGEYDAANIISHPEIFMLVTGYAADIFHDFLQAKSLSPTNVKFLAVNLRSSPFASALAFLLGFDFMIIDHLGPNHKLFNIDFNQNRFEESSYVYIGDFLVGGTEVRIAQSYINFLGGKLEHALVLGSYFKPEDGRFEGKFEYACLYCLKDNKNYKVQF